MFPPVGLIHFFPLFHSLALQTATILFLSDLLLFTLYVEPHHRGQKQRTKNRFTFPGKGETKYQNRV